MMMEDRRDGYLTGFHSKWSSSASEYLQSWFFLFDHGPRYSGRWFSVGSLPIIALEKYIYFLYIYGCYIHINWAEREERERYLVYVYIYIYIHVFVFVFFWWRNRLVFGKMLLSSDGVRSGRYIQRLTTSIDLFVSSPERIFSLLAVYFPCFRATDRSWTSSVAVGFAAYAVRRFTIGNVWDKMAETLIGWYSKLDISQQNILLA